ncbi:hypothetical protein CAP35_08920 [Chitinophagaceae bacterium IBVUCB1]|nr:hypothetical protein CAP35_08920 [Chitinophagaceae bacterium IBVUCB1]
MKKIVILLVSSVLLASCQQSKEDMIARKWQAVKVDNKQQDSLFDEQEKFLDTFGKNNTEAINMAIYGFTNVDSARESLKAQLKDYRAMQQHAVENTTFNFDRKGTAVMNFSGQIDTVKWTLTKEGKLELEEDGKAPEGSKITMEILELTKSALQLKFTDNSGTSTVSFKPAAK